VGIVLTHADLLRDDTLLLVHLFGVEEGMRNKVEQHLKRLIKGVGRREQIGGFIKGGEGIGVCAEPGITLKGVHAVLVFKQLVLQKMGDALRIGSEFGLALGLEGVVDRAVPRADDGIGGGQLLREDADDQSAVQRLFVIVFAQALAFLSDHFSAHASSPFKKYTVSSAIFFASSTT